MALDAIKRMRQDRKQLLQLKQQFGKQDWIALRSCIVEQIVKGRPVLGRFISGSGEIASESLSEYQLDSVFQVLRCLNRLYGCRRLFGGMFKLDVFGSEGRPLADQIGRIVLVLFAECALAASKDVIAQEHANAMDQDSPTLWEDLCVALRSSQIQLTEEWYSRFDNLMQNNQDACCAFLLSCLNTGMNNWVVLLQRTNPGNERRAYYDFASDSKLDFDGGGICLAHAPSMSECEDLIKPRLYPDLGSCFTEEKNVVGVCGIGIRLFAHGYAFRDAVQQRIESFSGFFSLVIPYPTTDCKAIHAYSQHDVNSGAAANELFAGMAISTEEFAPDMEDVDCILCKSYRETNPIEVPSVRLPRSDVEFQALHAIRGFVAIFEFFDSPSFSCPMIEQLRKALHFWCRAERGMVMLDSICVSRWELASAFMDYCTILEIFLGVDTGITDAISTRASWICTDVPEERPGLLKELKSLYGKRSKYVHLGEASIDEENVLRVREFSRHCLLYALHWTQGECVTRRQMLSNSEPDDSLLFDQIIDALESVRPNDFQEHLDRLRSGGQRIRPRPNQQKD